MWLMMSRSVVRVLKKFSIWIYNPESQNCPQEFKWLQGPGSFHFVDLDYDFAPMRSIFGIVMVIGLVVKRAEDAPLSGTKKLE